jgi:predicted MFS family arabinose efflux permease
MSAVNRGALAPSALSWGLGFTLAAYVLSFFHRMSPSVLAADLQASLGIGATPLGYLAATYFYVYALMQVPAGVLADTWGPRRLLFWGGMVASGGSMLFGLAPDFGWAFAGRTLIGLGVSVTFIAMLKLIALGFSAQRFATITGMAMVVGNCGAVLAGAPLIWALQAFGGWRPVFVGVGVVTLLIAWGCARCVAPSPHASKIAMSWRQDLWSVLKNRATWPGFFVSAGLCSAFFAFGGLWLVPFLTQVHGMSRALASNHLSIFFGGFASGCLLWGAASDYFKNRRAMMLGIACANVLCWLFWVLAPAQGLTCTASLSLCLATGFTSAAFTLTWPAAKEVNPPHLSGMATSVVNTGGFVGGALMQPLSGWVIERGWDGMMVDGVRIYAVAAYERGLWLFLAASLIGCVAVLWLTETHCRNPVDEGLRR